MDLEKIVAELRLELANINAAINSLERLRQGRAAREELRVKDSGEGAAQPGQEAPRAAGKAKTGVARGARS